MARTKQGGRGRGGSGPVRRLVGLMAFLPVASRAPTYSRLIWELIRDDRTPAGRKALLAGGLGYLVLGRDLIPDSVPIIGGLDDVVVLVLAVDLFLEGIPAEVLNEKLDLLGIDRGAYERDIAQVRRLMPGPVRRAIHRLPGAIAAAGRALDSTGIAPRVRTWMKKEGSIA